MQKAIRSQADDDQDIWSANTGIDCSDAEDMARQEFKEETDINNILRRFGLNGFLNNDGRYTDTDYTIDLQSALTTISDARQTFEDLPANIREKYPTMPKLVNALENGTFDKALLNPATPPQPVTETPKPT